MLGGGRIGGLAPRRQQLSSVSKLQHSVIKVFWRLAMKKKLGRAVYI